MDFYYQCDGEIKAVRAERDGEIVRITMADRVYEVNLLHSRAGELTFAIDGTIYTTFIVQGSSTRYVGVDGDVFELRDASAQLTRRMQHQGENNLVAPMPGLVTKVLVNEGDVVRRGQALIILEAMKMEIKIVAPQEGHIAKVLVGQGQVVDRDQRLVELSQSG